MSDSFEWTSRVDQMTGATVHEQLRAVIRDAQGMLQEFNASASEQGGLLLDAQRDLEATLERRMTQVSEELSRSVAALRDEMATFEHAPSGGSIDLESLRKELFAGLAAFGGELDAETKKLRAEIAGRMGQIASRLTSMEEAQNQLEARVVAAQSSADERFAAILGQLERSAGMEQRAAAHLVDLLASAFAGLQKDQGAANGHTDHTLDRSSVPLAAV